MALEQRRERSQLKARQSDRWAQESRERASRFDRGVRGLWSQVTGKHAAVQKQNERDAYEALQRDRAQRQSLIDAQMKDRQALQAQIKGVRDRYAAILKDLRTDQQAARQMAKSPELRKDVPQVRSSMDERLERLRSGERSQEPSRGRDWDRER